MSDPRTIIERGDAALKAHDVDAYMALVADDAVTWMPAGPDGREVRGKDAIRSLMDNGESAYSDMKMDVLHRYVDGDTVITETRATGTHTGSLLLSTGEELPATGEALIERAVTIERVVDGKIVETRSYYDRNAVLQQLHQVPAATTAG